MRVTPKTEKEIQSMNLIQDGVYKFEVVSAEDTISKKGNEMIKLNLKIWDTNGFEKFVFDYLLDAMAFKLLHFSEATGLIDKYNLGSIVASDCLHKTGCVEIIIEEGKNGYSDKNSVKDYISKLASNKIYDAPLSKNPAPFDDSIPF